MALPAEHIQKLLKEVVDHFDKEDTAVRERQIRMARRLKLMWEGYQLYYSEVAHDWRIYDESVQQGDSDQVSYDHPVNVFRAYLESIIAALSITVPPIKCFPDDADNTLDLATARAGDKISALIYRHNDVPLLWLHSLFIYVTEGMVACYNYPKADVKFGTYKVNKEEEVEENHQYTTCPECGYQIDDQVMPPDPQAAALKNKAEQYQDEFMPDETDVPIQDIVQNADPELCPNCLQFIAPLLSQEQLVVTRIVGVTNEPKSRMCLESYGLLYVKIANYAKKPEDTPYLGFSYETHYANVIERYGHLHKTLRDKLKASAGPKDPYEEWGRLNPQYQGEYPQNVINCKNYWLRHAAFNILDEEDAKELKKLYPNGVKVVLANDCFADAENEALDDCWTLTINPLADFLNHDPLGLLLVSIQEITNDLISLITQTIEHGIGQTFADPGVLNFDAYRQMESVPGAIYEATPKSGKSIAESFHEMKTATLSPEVMPFATNVQSLGQLVSGALPSLFGGALEGSETASQYSMSRAQALQRLQNTWKMFTTWWKQIFGKTIPMYIKEVKDDERDVVLDGSGNFVNVFIRKAELEGKIGKIEIEANENLPMTWSQIKDAIMQLFEINNEQILSVIGAPENLPIIRDALGLTDFYIPGEADVIKQNDEIKLLLNSTPLPTGDPMNPEMPSVEIDVVYDNHEVEFEAVRKWVISEAGRQAKLDNPEGHANVLLHGKMHWMQMQMQAAQAMAPQSQVPGEKPTENTETPIEEESNVPATV